MIGGLLEALALDFLGLFLTKEEREKPVREMAEWTRLTDELDASLAASMNCSIAEMNNANGRERPGFDAELARQRLIRGLAHPIRYETRRRL